jgi:hypothetical protein
LSRVLAKRNLVPHPDGAAPAISLGTKVSLLGAAVLKFEYVVIGALDALQIAPIDIPNREDGLWQHTCFEAFIGFEGADEYYEFNFASSRRWASYRFDGYRDGMADALGLPTPDIYVETYEAKRLALTAYLDLTPLEHFMPWKLGLSSVIETSGGALSYWALNHPVGRPDFHHRDCFALKLAPPEKA